METDAQNLLIILWIVIGCIVLLPVAITIIKIAFDLWHFAVLSIISLYIIVGGALLGTTGYLITALLSPFIWLVWGSWPDLNYWHYLMFGCPTARAIWKDY